MYQKDKFIKEVSRHILEYLPDEYAGSKVTTERVIKNNGTEYISVLIRNSNANSNAPVPAIYLDPYFQEYIDGTSFEEILARIAKVRMEHEISQPSDFSKVMDFEYIKDSVVFKLINSDLNRELLKDTASRDVADLSLCYDILTEQFDIPGGRIRIKKDMLTKMDISENDLYESALRNMQKLFPAIITPLSEMVQELLEGQTTCPEQHNEFPVSVVTNEKGMYGAAAVMYPEVIEKLEMESCFILPSSVHELLAIPRTEICIEALTQMVRDVNQTAVSPDEILSYNIYEINNGSLSLAMVDDCGGIAV